MSQIMGASGSGKTSLLRAIAGLWRSGAGSIKRYVKYREAKKDGDRIIADNSKLETDKTKGSDQNLPEEVIGLHLSWNL